MMIIFQLDRSLREWYSCNTVIIISWIIVTGISRIWSNSTTWLINYTCCRRCDTLTINACCESWIGFYLCSRLYCIEVLKRKHCSDKNDSECNNQIITMITPFHHTAVILFLLLLRITMLKLEYSLGIQPTYIFMVSML
jgi:hypothetical protein